MPRPRKCREVCCLPKSTLFGPISTDDKEIKTIVMTIDEYETIRLIDLEGMMQEGCAEKMNVARTTVQRIYNNARLKLAKALVNGDILKIEGGDYKLCEENSSLFGCGKCYRQKCCLINGDTNLNEE